MKHILKTILLVVAVSFAFSNSSFAQKKGETKLYNNVIAQNDTLSFNKFLAKYPNSVYAPRVQAKKDSLIKSYNTTVYTTRQAEEFIKSAIPELQNAVAGKDFIALPHKKQNVEYITGVIAPTASDPSLEIVKLQEKDGSWQIVTEKSESVYRQDDNLTLFAFVPQDNFTLNSGRAEDISNETLGKNIFENGEKYLQFSYLNYTNAADPRSRWENKDAELVKNIVSLSDETLYSAMYSGELNENILHGSCTDASQGGALATPQMDYLIRSFGKHPLLAPANKEREITKEAIKWWYKNNPQGKTTLEFGVLDPSHPIVKLFLEDKYQESSANYTAAFFNIMNTTVLCVYNKSTKQYLLAWCEPQVKDKKTEKELNTIYFEKNNTLVLYYYQGNKTFKERINLGTRKKF